MKTSNISDAQAAWLDYLEHLEEEDPVIQRWFREDSYAVRTIFRAGFFDGSSMHEGTGDERDGS